MSENEPAGDRENRSLLRSRGLVAYGVCLVMLGNAIAFTASATTYHPNVAEFTQIAIGVMVPTLFIGIGLTMFRVGLAGILQRRG